MPQKNLKNYNFPLQEKGSDNLITIQAIPPFPVKRLGESELLWELNRLKNSSNAEHHFVLAQYFAKLQNNYEASISQLTTKNEEKFPYELKALRHFKRAITLNPMCSKYHISFAEYLDRIYKKRWQGEKYSPSIKKEVMQHFGFAIKTDKEWDHPFRAYGNWLFSLAGSEEICNENDLLKQTIDLAVALYKEAIRRNNSLLLEGIEKYNAFTNNYDELKKIIPDVPQLYYSFAKYLQKNGLWEIYESNFYNDIRSHTERFLFYKAMVEYLCQNKRPGEGVSLLKEYLEYAPKDIPARLWVSKLLFYDVHDKEEGIKVLEIALQLKPEDLDILFSYGKMLFHHGKYEESAEILKRVLSRDTKRHEACFLIGQSYEKLFKMSEAEDYYEQAISLNPNSTEYKRYLIRLRIKLKTNQQ
ncbi:MAG: TPR repeat [Candidatus Jettenia ecosi]|uniref:TPR repeat n=1 Tax=Candidatus Jettenia ecosi TaxID=2494326 RepID=A0A533Q9V0_9BACT|nr:MAG: TPR repeat [Candidatus Jettenia ecosi]